jgi:DNA polymerase III sliding clamp (beta) subunit (PCNA family)
MKIHRDLLLNALKVPLSALGNGDMGANLKFQPEDGAILICGTDSILYAWQRIVCAHDLTEAFCTKGRPLADLVAAMPSVELDFLVEFPRLTIKAKSSRYSLPLEDAASFAPHPDESLEPFVSLETDSLKTALEMTNWVPPEGSQALTYWDGLCMRSQPNSILFAAAAHSHMAAHSMLGLTDPGEWDVLLPRKQLATLPKLLSGETVGILPSSGSVRFTWPNAGFQVQQIDAKSPPYERMIAQERTYSFDLSRAELMSTLKRILTLSVISKHDRPWGNATFDGAHLEISAPDAGLGEALETIDAIGEPLSEPLTFRVDLAYLSSALPHVAGDVLHWYVHETSHSMLVGSASPDSIVILMHVVK